MAIKRIMRAFKLSEISGVTKPAQQGAVAAILKRDFSDEGRQKLADKKQALADGSYPIVTASDLKNAVQSYGRAKDPEKVKAHIIARAKALGATDALPDGWVGKSDNIGEPDMSELRRRSGSPRLRTNAEVLAAVTKANKAATDASAAAAELAKLKAKLDKGDMSDKHTAFMNNEKATMPKGGKSAFMAMEPGERDDHMKANPIKGEPDGDEVVKVNGVTLRKSVVGADVFAVLQAQQADIAKNLAEIAKERDAREIADSRKRQKASSVRCRERRSPKRRHCALFRNSAILSVLPSRRCSRAAPTR